MKKSQHTSTPRRKLVLQPETIAVLTPPQLSRAAGGITASQPICGPTPGASSDCDLG